MLPGIAIFYVTGGVLIVLSVLGTYGAWAQKRWALILVRLSSDHGELNEIGL